MQPLTSLLDSTLKRVIIASTGDSRCLQQTQLNRITTGETIMWYCGFSLVLVLWVFISILRHLESYRSSNPEKLTWSGLPQVVNCTFHYTSEKSKSTQISSYQAPLHSKILLPHCDLQIQQVIENIVSDFKIICFPCFPMPTLLGCITSPQINFYGKGKRCRSRVMF